MARHTTRKATESPDCSRRTVRLLSWFNFLNDFRLYAPVASLYYAQISGSYTAGMSVISAVMLSSVILELPTGVLSDLIGRKKTLVMGAALSLLSVCVYAMAPGFGVLLIGAGLEGASMAFFSGNNNALLFDSLKGEGKEDRFHAFLGTVSSFGQFALAVSAALGGIISASSFRLVMAASAVPQAAALILSFMVPEPRRREKEAGPGPVRLFLDAVRKFFRNPRILAVGGSNMMAYAAGEACFQFSGIFIASLWPLWAVGLSRTLSNLGAAVSFKLSGRLIDRFKELPLLFVSRLYGRVAHIAAAAVPTVASPVIMASTSLFFGVSIVSGESLMQKEFSDAERATMGSIGSLGGNLLMAAFAPVMGLVADAAGAAAAVLSAQAFMLIPLAILFVELRRAKNAAARKV